MRIFGKVWRKNYEVVETTYKFVQPCYGRCFPDMMKGVSERIVGVTSRMCDDGMSR